MSERFMIVRDDGIIEVLGTQVTDGVAYRWKVHTPVSRPSRGVVAYLRRWECRPTGEVHHPMEKAECKLVGARFGVKRITKKLVAEVHDDAVKYGLEWLKEQQVGFTNNEEVAR